MEAPFPQDLLFTDRTSPEKVPVGTWVVTGEPVEAFRDAPHLCVPAGLRFEVERSNGFVLSGWTAERRRITADARTQQIFLAEPAISRDNREWAARRLLEAYGLTEGGG